MAEQSQLHLARRAEVTSSVTGPKRDGGDSASDFPTARLHSGAGPVRSALPEASRPGEPIPIWLAALVASPCNAKRNGEYHAVRWDCVSGRALYTNAGREDERIEPLGVSLMGGHTIAVYWMPGETAYTVEVYRQKEKVA